MNDLKQTLQAILTTLDHIEVKGYENLDRMCGVMMLLKRIINQMEVNANADNQNS